MRNFLYKTIGVLIVLLLCNSIMPLMGLYRLHKNYPAIPTGIVKFLKHTDTSTADILVIGCSNLQHNIAIREIQQNIDGIDFIYFSGSQSSTVITYLSDYGFMKKYKHLIMYAPYQMLEKNNFVNLNDLHYEGFASFQYAQSVIRHNPLAFFFNWNKYCDSVDIYRKPFLDRKLAFNIEQCEIEKDPFVDSINQPGTSFSNCNEHFEHSRHVIKIPRFADEDVEFINSIAYSGQTINVIYIPIPDIKEDRYGLNREKEFFKTFPKALNQPEMMDTSYFYDQWYHLNKCGKDIEMQKLLTILKKYKAGLSASKP